MFYSAMIVKWRVCEHYSRTRGEGGGGRRRVTHDKSASKPTTRQDIRPPLQPQLWPADQLQYHNMCNYNYNYNYQPSLWCNNTGSHQAKPVTSCGGESNQSSVDEKVWFHLIKYQSVVCQGLRPFIVYIMGREYFLDASIIKNRKTSKQNQSSPVQCMHLCSHTVWPVDLLSL